MLWNGTALALVFTYRSTGSVFIVKKDLGYVTVACVFSRILGGGSRTF